ncbi:ribonuclease E inhibitor RraB [Phenylobacterium aquaticum]|uniref:ribonuclease E inhibitor RraB n=1 Tax=Phenylobacterium aquaticum TaxID=1763816 RepID=UPI0026F35412|nr:ribonuclease E inhibitor RraB [Phenylobacterium aquaticum]
MSVFEENAEVLRNMARGGSELGSPRSIDFSHVFPDSASAKAFAQEADREGFATSVEEAEGEDAPWDVTASVMMAPTCENITNTEERLDGMAQAHGGRSDGWGFFRT